MPILRVVFPLSSLVENNTPKQEIPQVKKTGDPKTLLFFEKTVEIHQKTDVLQVSSKNLNQCVRGACKFGGGENRVRREFHRYQFWPTERRLLF